MVVDTTASVQTNLDIDRLVEPERVHRRVFADPALFELEMDRITRARSPSGVC